MKHTDMEAHVIYRQIGKDRHFLCYDRRFSKAAWIAESMLDEVKERFPIVKCDSIEDAKYRAEHFAWNAHATTINI